MKIGELVAMLRVDRSQFDRGVDAARAKLQQLADDSDRAGTRGSGALSAFGSAAGLATKAVAGLAGATSAVQAVGGLVGVATAASGALLLLPAAAGAGALAMGTLSVATSGWGDAMSAIDDPAKFAEAIAKLSPAAREAATAVRELRPAWQELQQSVQDKAFAGVAEQVTNLGTRYLPILGNAMRGVARDANAALIETAKIFDQDAKAAQMGTALSYVRQAIGNLSAMMPGLATGFSNVFAVGASFLPGLTAGAGDLAQRFAEWSSNTENLRQIMSQGLSVIGQLGQVAGNLGSIISGVFNAANISGGGFLNNLVMITGQIAAMVNSAQGQETLTTLFSVGAQLSALLMQALQALLPVLPPLVTALGQVAVIIGTALVQAITLVAPLLQQVAQWAAANPALLTAIVAAIAALVVGFQGLTILGTVAGWVITAYNAFMKIKQAFTIVMGAFNLLKIAFMTNPWLLLIGAVIALVVLIVSNWDTIKAATLAAWEAVKSAVLAAWEAVKAAISAAVAFVSGLISGAWSAITGATSAAWSAITGAVSAAWDFLSGIVSSAASAVVNFLSNAWSSAVSLASNAWSNIVSAVQSGASNVLSFVSSLPGRILSALGNLGSLLYNAGMNVIQGLWNGIRSMGSWLASQIMGFIRSFVPGPVLQFLGIASPSKFFRDEIGKWIPEGLGEGIIGNAKAAADAARRMAVETADAATSAARSGVNGMPGDAWMPPVTSSSDAAGGRSVNVDVVINNPRTEPGSDSFAREMADLSTMGAFDL